MYYKVWPLLSKSMTMLFLWKSKCCLLAFWVASNILLSPWSFLLNKFGTISRFPVTVMSESEEIRWMRRKMSEAAPWRVYLPFKWCFFLEVLCKDLWHDYHHHLKAREIWNLSKVVYENFKREPSCLSSPQPWAEDHSASCRNITDTFEPLTKILIWQRNW